MYFALDASTGQRVHAREAQRYRRYRCPLCRAQVNPRQGSYREPHFAHAPGQGSAACEEFHPSDGWSGPAFPLDLPDTPVQHLPRQSLSLLLSVEPKSGRTPAEWGLEVLIPKSPTRGGVLTFDGGGDGFRVQIACAKLYEGIQRCRVSLDADSYRVSWVSTDVDRAYAQVVQERLPGPTPSKVTAFVAARGAGKARTEVLNWGGSYYLIHRASVPIDLPAEILSARLAVVAGWACCLVTLPSVADQFIADWLKQHTGLPVASLKRQWAVALPTVHGLDPAARLVLDSTKELLLAVHPGEGSTLRLLRVTCDGEEVACELQPSAWNFVRIAGFSQSFPPAIAVDEHLLPELLVRPFARTLPEVLLQIDAELVNARAQRAGELLQSVRNGEAELTALFAPVGLDMTAKYRKPSDLDFSTTPIAIRTDPSRGNGVVAAGELQSLTTILRDHDCDVELSFGPFGYWYAHSKTAAANEPTLTAVARDHASWVLKAAGRPHAAKIDAQIAAEILALRPPRWLIAHHRVAKVRVQREGHAA